MKLRTRAAYMGMLGLDMEAMMRGDGSGRERSSRNGRAAAAACWTA